MATGVDRLVASKAMSRTLVIIKPDAVERGLVGRIISRFEERGLRFAALELRVIDRDTVAKHYAEHEGKPFYGELVDFLSRGPSVVAVIEGPGRVVEMVRKMMGTTNPEDAEPGTIRGDLAMLVGENLIHGSDSQASAKREIELFFPHMSEGH